MLPVQRYKRIFMNTKHSLRSWLSWALSLTLLALGFMLLSVLNSALAQSSFDGSWFNFGGGSWGGLNTTNWSYTAPVRPAAMTAQLNPLPRIRVIRRNDYVESVVLDTTFPDPGGSGYTKPPTIYFSDPGAGALGRPAVFRAVLDGNGSINSFEEVDRGSGYTGNISAQISQEVTGVVVTSAGSGYAQAPLLNFSGGGAFNTSSPPAVSIRGGVGGGAELSVNVTGSAITSVNVINPGRGYSTALRPSIQVIGFDPLAGASGASVGSGASLTPSLGLSSRSFVLVNGASFGLTDQSFAVTSGTQTYSVAPKVTISGGGAIADATATAVLDASGLVTGIKIVNPGSGYFSAPTLSFSGGTVLVAGTAPTATGNTTNFKDLSDTFGVTAQSFTIASGTQTYSVAPTVTISGGGAKVDATASASINASGLVNAITITDPGRGYTSAPTLTFSGGTVLAAGTAPSAEGNAANFVDLARTYSVAPTVTITGGGATSAPTATAVLINGKIAGISVSNPGNGYTSAPTAAFSGGTIQNNGLTPSLVVDDDFFVISSVVVAAGGTGYNPARPPVARVVGRTPSFAAQASVVVIDGRVAAVPLSQSGSGYTYPPVVVISGGPAGLLGGVRAEARISADGQVEAIELADDIGGVSPAAGGAGGAQAIAQFSQTDKAQASMGVISSVQILDGGQGYSSVPTITVGATAQTTAVAVSQITDGSVSSVSVPNQGSGYVVAPLVTPLTNRWTGYTANPLLRFSSNGVTAALANANFATTGANAGKVTSLSLVDGGAGYTAAPEVILVGGKGSGASATAFINRGAVIGVVVTNGGSGYGTGAEAPRIVFGGNFLVGTSFGAEATANVSGGRIVSITVTRGGFNYWTPPQVFIQSGTPTTKATATATLTSGRVSGFAITDGGSGYTSSPIVAFKTGTTTFPVANVSTSVTYFNTPFAGRVYQTNVLYPGEGWTGSTSPQVVLTGGVVNGGPQATLQVIRDSVAGTVRGLWIANPGGAEPARLLANLSPQGGVGSVQIISGGTGYLSAPLLVLEAPTGNAAPLALAPGGPGSFVQFTRDIGNIAVSLDAQRVVGSLSIGDGGGGDPLGIVSGTGGTNSSLVMSMGPRGGGRAFFNKRQGGNDYINAPLELRDQVHLSLTGGSLTLNGPITGSGGLQLNGGATLFVRSSSTGATRSPLWLGNRGTIELGSRGGPIFGSIRLGDNSYGSTGGSATLQLWASRGSGLADRSAFLDQIDDAATVLVDAVANRWGYLKLLGGDERIGNLVDLNNAVVLENMEGEGINTDASLVLGGNNLDSYIGGYARDRASGGGTGALGIVKEGSGRLLLRGGNISYTGDTVLKSGVLRLTNTSNFASRIVASEGTRVEIETTSNVDFSRGIVGSANLVKLGSATLSFRSGNLDLDNLRSQAGTINILPGAASFFGASNRVAGALGTAGESGLSRSMRLGGSVSVGSLRVEGAFWDSSSNSETRVEGQDFTTTFTGITANTQGFFTDGVLESRGAVEAVNSTLRMAPKEIARTFEVASAANGTTAILKDITNVVVGAVVVLGPTESAYDANLRHIVGGTVVTAVNPATREVTFNNPVKLAAGTKLGFYFSSTTDGVIRAEYLAYTSAVYDPVSALFVAVTANGTIHTSANGTSWTEVRRPEFEGVALNAIAIKVGVAGVAPSQFVAVGDNGRILYNGTGDPAEVRSGGVEVSNDWQLVGSTGTGMALYAVVNRGGDRWVAVGRDGTIISSGNPSLSWQQTAGAPSTDSDLLGLTSAGAFARSVTVAASNATTVGFADVSNIGVGDEMVLTWGSTASGSVVVPASTKVTAVGTGTVTLDKAVSLPVGTRVDFLASMVAVGRQGEVLRSLDGQSWSRAALPMNSRSSVIRGIVDTSSERSLILSNSARVSGSGATSVAFANLRADTTATSEKITNINGADILRPGSMVVFNGVQAGASVVSVDVANRSARLSMPSTASGYVAIRTIRGLTSNRVLPITGASVYASYNAPNLANLFERVNHGLNTGDAVTLAGIANGAGLKAGFTYYVIRVSDSSFKLADNLANARAGVSVIVRNNRFGVTVLPSANIIREVSNTRGLRPGMLLHGTSLSAPAVITAIDEVNRSIIISGTPTLSGVGYFGVLYGTATANSTDLTALRLLPSMQALSGLSEHLFKQVGGLPVGKDISEFPGRTAFGGTAVASLSLQNNSLMLTEPASGSGYAPLYTIKGITSNGSDVVSGLTAADLAGLQVGQEIYLNGSLEAADVFEINGIAAINPPSSSEATDGELVLRAAVNLNRDSAPTSVDLGVFTGKFTEGQSEVTDLSNRVGVPAPQLDLPDYRSVLAVTRTRFFAVGNNGGVLTSADGGLTWTSSNSGTGRDLYSAVMSGTRVMVAGEDGLILDCDQNGTGWTTLRAPDRSDLLDARQVREVRALVNGGGNLVALGRGGLARSGTTWSTSPNDTFSGSSLFLTVAGRAGAPSSAASGRAGEINIRNQYSPVVAAERRIAPGSSGVLVNTNNSNRIEDSIVLRSLGGVFSFENNNADAAFRETVGGLWLDQGQLRIEAFEAGAAGSSRLTFNSLSRTPGATVDFVSRVSPNTTPLSGSMGRNSRNQVMMAVAPTLDNGIVGGWATLDNEWATYDATNGFAKLASGGVGYSDVGNGANSTSFTAAMNARFLGGIALSNANRALNSIKIDSSNTLNLGTGFTSIESGGVLVPNVTATIANSRLTVGGAAGTSPILYLNVNGTLNLGSIVNNAPANITKIEDFSSTVPLSSTSSVTALTFANAASLTGLLPGMSVSGSPSIPTGTVIQSISGTQVTLSRALTGSIAASTPITFTGAPVSLAKSGSGTLVFFGTNATGGLDEIGLGYTGKTYLNAGVTQVSGTGRLLEFGRLPRFLVADHLQINGGTLRFANPAVNPLGAFPQLSTINDTRGIQIGSSGGRIEVGQGNPAPDTRLDLVIESPIRALGVLELAVSGNGVNQNRITLGRQGGANLYQAGLKMDNGFNGDVIVLGSNTIGGVYKQSGNLIIDGDASGGGNNFTLPIRSTAGNLTLRGRNLWLGGSEFIEPLVISGGTLRLEGAEALGGGGLRLDMGGSARLSLGGESRRIVQLTNLSANNNAAIDNSGGLNQAATLTMDLDQNADFFGSIEDGGNSLRLVKTGSATLNLRNENSSFSGGLEILQGGVDVSSIDNGFGGVFEFSGLGQVLSADPQNLKINGGMLSFTLSRPQVMARSFTMGAGPMGAAIASRGVGRTSGITIGRTSGAASPAVAFEGSGNRIFTLAGTSISNNIFALEIGDKSATEVTSVHKMGAGNWILSKPNAFTGWTTVANGSLGATVNDAFGSEAWEVKVTPGQPREFEVVGTKPPLPEGVELGFITLNRSLLPDGITANGRYSVEDVDVASGTFRLAARPEMGGQIPVPMAALFGLKSITIQSGLPREFFSAENLPNGTVLTLPQLVTSVLPTGMNASDRYVVVDSQGGYFRVASEADAQRTPISVSFGAQTLSIVEAGTANTGSTFEVSNPLPNGTQLSFSKISGQMPVGLVEGISYSVVQAQGNRFKVSFWPGGSPVMVTPRTGEVSLTPKKVLTQLQPISSVVQVVPRFVDKATTTVDPDTDEFTGWVPVGSWVVFGRKALPVGVALLPELAGGQGVAFEEGRPFYVSSSARGRFKIKANATDPNPLNFDTSGTPDGLFYSTNFKANDSGGVNLMAGGAVDLRNVDYRTPERMVLEGGALRVPAGMRSVWGGNIDVNTPSTIQVDTGGSLTINGILDGSRGLTQEGEGNLVFAGESLASVLNGNNIFRSMTVRAGLLTLDYSLNGQSKLVDQAPLNLGGSRRGGSILLRGGDHIETVLNTVLESGANTIKRDSGTSVMRLNAVARQLGGTLMVDGGRMAQIDNLNVGGILGAWAVIRDTVVNANWVIDGTTSGTVTVSSLVGAVTPGTNSHLLTASSPHTLRDGTAVRMVSGSAPAQIQSGVFYYVADSRGTSRTFRLARTYRDAINPRGARVLFSGPWNQSFALSHQLIGILNASGDQISTGDGHGLVSGSRVRLSPLIDGETMPPGLSSSVDYYVVFPETKSLKLSLERNGPPIDLRAGPQGSAMTLAIETQGAHRFAGPASASFRVADSFRINGLQVAGEQTNGRVKVLLRYTAQIPSASNEVTRTGSGSIADPYVFVINTSPAASSPVEIEAMLSRDPENEVRDILVMFRSTAAPTSSFLSNFSNIPTAASFGAYDQLDLDGNPTAQSLDGGTLDNGSRELDWARAQMADGSLVNLGDAFVAPNSTYSDGWDQLLHTSLRANLTSLSVDQPKTYSVRFAAQNEASILLDLARVHTVRSGGILVSPTVGANDVRIAGAGSLTTENQGNVGNLVAQQYNPLGMLVIGSNMVDRGTVVRGAYLTSNGGRTIYLNSSVSAADAAQLRPGWTVAGTGITVGSRIMSISPGGRVITLDRNHNGVSAQIDCTFSSPDAATNLVLNAFVSNPGRRVLAGILNPNPAEDGVQGINVGDLVRGTNIQAGTVVLEILADRQSVVISRDHTAAFMVRDTYEFEDGAQRIIRRRASLGGSGGNNRDVLFGVASPSNLQTLWVSVPGDISVALELAALMAAAPGGNWSISGPGIAQNTRVTAVSADGRVLTLSTAHSGLDGNGRYTVVNGSNRFAFNATTFASLPADQARVSTSDLYIGMPVSGRGILPGTVIREVLNESDIRLSSNHAYDGSWAPITFTPQTGFEKLGVGAASLTGINTYTGATYIANGRLRIGNLTNGGIAGPLGASSAAAGNLIFNGSELQYQGESAQTNRGFTVADFATLNIGHERTVAAFTGGIASGTDTLNKQGSGTLVLSASMNLGTLSVQEGTLALRTVDSNPSPSGFSPSNFSTGSQTSLRMEGGRLEVVGSPEGNATQTLGGALVLAGGGSEIRVTSPLSSISVGTTLATSLQLMGQVEEQPIQRGPGATVRFALDASVVEGRYSSAEISIALDKFSNEPLSYAVFQPYSGGVAGKVTQFAMVNAPALGQNYGKVVGASSVQYAQIANFNDSLYDYQRLAMQSRASAVGMFITEDFAALQGNLDTDSYARLLRYDQPYSGTVTVGAGKFFQLTDGAILLTEDAVNAVKEIAGASADGLAQGTLQSGLLNAVNSDLIVHQYNPSGPLKISAAIGDRTVRLAPAQVRAEAGAMEILLTKGISELELNSIRAGMKVSLANQDGSAVTAVDTSIVSISLEEVWIDFDGDGRRDSGERFSHRLVLDKPLLANHVDGNLNLSEATNLVQSGLGTTIISSPSGSYSGKTFVQGGVLRVDNAGALPGGLALQPEGSTLPSSAVVIQGGVLGLGYGDFTRSTGSLDSQVLFTTSGGFAAYGQDRTVNLGGQLIPDTVRYGNSGFVPDGSSLVLGSRDATNKLIFANPIDLSSFSQAVRVEQGPAQIEGELSGTLSGLGQLVKFGKGSLLLSGSNDHRGGIEIADGRLVASAVEDVFGLGGAVRMGTSATNSTRDSGIELHLQGGGPAIANPIEVGSVNSRAAPWMGSMADPGQAGGGEFAAKMVGGLPAVAYRDTAGQLRFARALDQRGLSWGAPVLVDPVAQISGTVSLEVVNGVPAISYYSSMAKALMYVRATDSQGVTWGAPISVTGATPSVVEVDAQGRALLGGSFAGIDGEYADASGNVVNQRLIRFNLDGSVDTTFRPRILNGEVRCILVLSDGDILVGGTFTSVFDDVSQRVITRNRMARFSPTGSLRSYDPSPNGDVRTIVRESASKIMVVGAFTAYANLGRSRVVRLNADTLSVDTTFATDIRNGEVRAVLPVDVEGDGTMEYMLGGSFTDVAGVNRNRMIRVLNNGAVDGSFGIDVNNTVNQIELWNSRYLIAGAFTAFQGGALPRQRLALVNSNGALDETFLVDANNEVKELCMLSDGSFMASGSFTQVAGFARFTTVRVLSTGAVDPDFSPVFNAEVRSVAEVSLGSPAASHLMMVGGFNLVQADDVLGDALPARYWGQHTVARLRTPTALAPSILDTTFQRLRWDCGEFASMCVVNGNPAIAFRDSANKDLCYVRSTDTDGNGWPMPETLDDGAGDASADLGVGISLVVGRAYGETWTKSNETTESTADDTITLSNTNIGATGAPIVVYGNASNGSLRYIAADGNNGTGYGSLGLKLPISNWSRPLTMTNFGNGIGRRFALTVVDMNDLLLPVVVAQSRAASGDSLRISVANSSSGITYPALRDASGVILRLKLSEAPPQLDWGTPRVVDSTGVGDALSADLRYLPAVAAVKQRATQDKATIAVTYHDVATGRLLIASALNQTATSWSAGQVVHATNRMAAVSQLLALEDGLPAVIGYSSSSSSSSGSGRLLYGTLSDSTGYSLLGFDGVTRLTGAMTLRGALQVQTSSAAAVEWAGRVAGAGGFRLWGGGSLTLSGSGNDFAASALAPGLAATPAASINGGAVLRSGVLRLASNGSLGRAVLEMGDARDRQVVAHAAIGTSLLSQGGTFNANHDGSANKTGGELLNDGTIKPPPGALLNLPGDLDLGPDSTELISSLQELGLPARSADGRVRLDLSLQLLKEVSLFRDTFLGDLPDGTLIKLYAAGLRFPQLPGPAGDESQPGFSLEMVYRVQRVSATEFKLQGLNASGDWITLNAVSAPVGIYYLRQSLWDARLLVSAEADAPQSHGVYQLAMEGNSVDRREGRINLKRVAELDELSEFSQGLQIQVGVAPFDGGRFFLATTIDQFNISPVYLIRDVNSTDKQVLISRSGTDLVNPVNVTVANAIDINTASVGSTGLNVIGAEASLTSGQAMFTGALTLQNRRAGAELESLRLLSNIGTGRGVEFGGVISEAAAEDRLSLIKQGTGVVSLSGSSTFAGGLSIEQGSLYVLNNASQGSATGSGAVSAADGTIVSGTGRIGGALTLGALNANGAGALLRPGNPLQNPTATAPAGGAAASVQTLQLDSSLIVNADSILEFRVGADFYTQLTTRSSIDLLAATPGAIRVMLADNYTPEVGTAFKILRKVNAAGAELALDLRINAAAKLYSVFDSLLQLPEELAWDTTLLASQGIIRVMGESVIPSFTTNLVAPTVLMRLGAPPPVSLSVAFDRGSDPFEMRWYFRASPEAAWTELPASKLLPNALAPVSAQLDLGLARASLEGQYKAVLYNNAQRSGVSSDVIDLKVDQPAAIVADLPAETKASAGQSLRLRISAYGESLTYLWQKSTAALPTDSDWTDVSAPSADSLMLQAADLATPTSYRVKVRGPVLPGVASNEVISRVTRVSLSEDASILEQPLSQTVLAGTDVTFTSLAGGGENERTQAWLFNGSPVAGEFTDTLRLPSVSLTMAGAYSMRVTNRPVVGGPLKTMTSDLANLTVVEDPQIQVNVVVGKTGTATATLRANVRAARGVVPTYQWLRNGSPLLPSVNAVGVATAVLQLKELVAEDSGTYACLVTGHRYTAVVGATHYLRVASAAPALVTTAAPPAGSVGRLYAWKIPTTSDSADPSLWSSVPTSYRVSGLPAGLRLNTATGWITGRPTAASADQVLGNAVVISITSAVPSASPASLTWSTRLMVRPTTAGLVGAYSGLIRPGSLNQNLGGRFDMTVASNGSLSGAVTLGAQAARRFVGALDFSGTQESEMVSARLRLAGTRTDPPLDFVFDLQRVSDGEGRPPITRLANASLSYSGLSVGVVGWRHRYADREVTSVSTLPSAFLMRNANQQLLATRYNWLINPTANRLVDNNSAPTGTGFVSLLLTAKGTYTFAGRSADGEVLSGAGSLGPVGELPIYAMLYRTATPGSLLALPADGSLSPTQAQQGMLRLVVAASAADNTVEGGMRWIKPLTSNLKIRTYRSGFGPLAMEAIGSVYLPTNSTQTVLGTSPLNPAFGDPAKLSFAETITSLAVDALTGTMDVSADFNPNLAELRILPGTSNKVVMPMSNPAAVALSIVAPSGQLSGSFKVQDTLAGGKIASRIGQFQGLVIRQRIDADTVKQYGAGYFLLPTADGSAVRSGLVILATP